MKSVLLVDDHSIVHKGLKTIISDMLGYNDVDEVESCSALMAALNKKEYTHLILDMMLPDGHCLEVLPNIWNLYSGLIIAIFSQQTPGPYLGFLENYGVKKYITKSSPHQFVVRGITDFLNDGKCKIYDGPSNETPFDNLSQRELEVLHYLLLGLKPREIQNRLAVSPQTVFTHTQRIYKKTNTDNIIDLKQLAGAWGI
ncbi:response regulator transcription factor [[Flexibacter] sp. ATCC 35208]|uniref:response regulator transcription factor n=1 Tax=[Flexibacter] sp. ATCC 35208 TaxID=1936242 RepID=UPI0009CCEC60|nr:response regulator transcription factor [[Flexibacter] sp. ATCC 35208]OMP80026.1 hypothetical protein BW716_05915 [[Flexibacter] sp. ATCC 35208]